MLNTLELVRDFHKQLKVEHTTKLFRIAMLREEIAELEQAVIADNPIETLDALTDIQYFLDGTYLAYEMDDLKDIAFREVHETNMRKIFPDGSVHRDPDGKVIKPPGWRKPDLDFVVKRHIRMITDPEELKRLVRVWERPLFTKLKAVCPGLGTSTI